MTGKEIVEKWREDKPLGFYELRHWDSDLISAIDAALETERQAHRDTIKTCLAQEKTIQRLTKGA